MIRLAIAFCAVMSSWCFGQVRVASFNLESGDADINYLINDMGKFGKDIDIWGFQEVNAKWFDTLIQGLSQLAGQEFRGIIGRSGGGDRLVIAYNATKLRLERYRELDWINIKNRVRAPLVATFAIKNTDMQFKFINNHLYRSSKDGRHEQARLLNDWGRELKLPAIAVGDYNFDWEIPRANWDLGFDLLTQDDVYIWVKPVQLIKTQCNPRFNSILDFVFLVATARSWDASSKIKFPEPDYCPDDRLRSDHRPVTAEIMMPGSW